MQIAGAGVERATAALCKSSTLCAGACGKAAWGRIAQHHTVLGRFARQTLAHEECTTAAVAQFFLVRDHLVRQQPNWYTATHRITCLHQRPCSHQTATGAPSLSIALLLLWRAYITIRNATRRKTSRITARECRQSTFRQQHSRCATQTSATTQTTGCGFGKQQPITVNCSIAQAMHQRWW